MKSESNFVTSCDILIVLNSLVAEGCPQLALSLSKYWISKGIKVQILCIKKYPLDLLEEFKEINIKVNFFSDLKKGIYRYLNLVFFTFVISKKLKPSSILCFLFGWHAFIALGAKLARVKNICAHVGNYPPINENKIRKFKLLVQLGRFFTNKCICCSDYILKGTREYFFLPSKSLCRVYNCCDFSKFQNNNNISLPLNKILNLGMVGRLENHKDQSTLIKAIPKILNKGIEVNLSIIGDGSKREQLEKLVKDLGLKNRVNFLGSRRDIPDLLSKIDIFVFSVKEDEGFGVALAEAMAAGVPILASDVGACLEILCNGKYGYIFEKGNPEDLALKVLKMNHESEKVRKKVVKARKYAKSRFSIKNMADSYMGYLLT